jgi:hypothetical protein
VTDENEGSPPPPEEEPDPPVDMEVSVPVSGQTGHVRRAIEKALAQAGWTGRPPRR